MIYSAVVFSRQRAFIMTMPCRLSGSLLTATVVVSSLGYMIDMFDLFLFNMLRGTSLKDLGLDGKALTEAGLLISNCQMIGLLIGACLWGVMADKFGRKIGLLSSIALYSGGMLLSAFVTDEYSYAAARFITGMGLAGELGAGLALIAESMTAARRGYGVLVFISLGFVGVLLAALTAEFMYWRHAYMLGGVAGIILLCARLSLRESALYGRMAGSKVLRGSFRILLAERRRFKFYISGIFLLVPAVFIPQLVWTLSPEIGRSIGVNGAVKANIVLGAGYSCVLLGDILASVLSEKLRSRKKAVLMFLGLGVTLFLFYLCAPPKGLTAFYMANAALGLTFGVWVVTVIWVAEHFGTNIRGLAVTTVPNFARGMTIPMNLAYQSLQGFGSLAAIGMIGGGVFVLAFLGWLFLSETHGKNLDYAEHY